MCAFVWFLYPLAITGVVQTDTPTFERDVAPILARHCVSCHGPDRSEGDLRVDSFEGLQRGGDLGPSVISPRLDESDLFARITSDDPAYRMPFGEPPLSDSDITTIRGWIENGAQGPLRTPAADDRAADDRAADDRAADDRAADDRTDGIRSWTRDAWTWMSVNPHLVPTLVLFLTAQVVFLVFDVLKRRERSRALKAGSEVGRIRPVRLVHYVGLWSVVAVLFAAGWTQGRIGELQDSVAKAQSATKRAQAKLAKFRETYLPGTNMRAIYGDPPRPRRLQEPVALSREYFRGNDERSDLLFNGGNYRTSTFWIELCDRSGKTVGYGDPIPAEGLCVRFEFDRSPGTASALYGDGIIERLHITEQFPRPQETPTVIETIEPGRRWRVVHPLKATGTGSVVGMTYVYYGDRIDYGIAYDVRIEDGRIAAESDLWMGHLYAFDRLLPPTPPGAVTQEEWFDNEPIPLIEGENALDPKLLGIDEHLGGAK